MKLHCINCNYQYTPKTGKVPSKCPYCSKDGTLEKVKDIQGWIDELADRENEKEEMKQGK